MSKQRNAMKNTNNSGKSKAQSKGWNYKRERRTLSEAPQFEVTGKHVVILVAAVMALA